MQFPIGPSLRRLTALAILGLVAGCDLSKVPVLDTPPVVPKARPDAQPVQPSAASVAMSNHYARVQADLLSQGLLRTDGGGPDVPYNSRQLAENFIRIALYDEYVSSRGSLIAQQTQSRLRRWEQPVKLRLEFGQSVPTEQRIKDRGTVAAYGARLSRVSGLPIRMTEGPANYHVFVLNEDERRGFGPRLRSLVPGIEDSAVRAITDMDRSTLCIVFAFSLPGSSAYSKAIAIIRGEHPDLLRRSCVHEEMAQGLGLANDSPAARPSIFNDDEEFALLTTQDEMMLRILYDRRLRTGMTIAEATPVVETIASELAGGES